MKRTAWAAGAALVVAVVSVVLLTLQHGQPTFDQVWHNGGTMFIVAFIVLVVFYRRTR